jgi:hypothetical protein
VPLCSRATPRFPPPRPVFREMLLREVWGYNSGLTTHTLETRIYRLRQKFENDTPAPAIHPGDDSRRVQAGVVMWGWGAGIRRRCEHAAEASVRRDRHESAGLMGHRTRARTILGPANQNPPVRPYPNQLPPCTYTKRAPRALLESQGHIRTRRAGRKAAARASWRTKEKPRRHSCRVPGRRCCPVPNLRSRPMSAKRNAVISVTLPDRGLAIGAGGLRRIRLIGSKAARDGVTPRRQNYPLRDASVRRASNETGAQSR